MPPRKQFGREMLQASESFVCADGTSVQKGDLVREGHEIVRAHADKFTLPRVRFEVPEVEQATAAPGEQRGRG